MLGTKFSGNTSSTTYLSTPSVNHTINDFAAITTLPKTTHVYFHS